MSTQTNQGASKAAAELSGIVNYDRLAAASPLKPPEIKKGDVPDFILCQNFEKAKDKVERALAKYDTKLSSIRSDIEAQEATIRRAEIDKPMFVSGDSSSARINKYNHCVKVINKANEKRNDLIDRLNDVKLERQERLEELTEEALLSIDDDIVAVLDKCNKIIDKLARSQNSDDAMTAVDVSFVALKVSGFFDDFIENNTTRRDCQERTAQVSTSMAALCKNEQVRNHLADIFRRNAYLVTQNAELLQELLRTLAAVKQPDVDRLKKELDGIMGEQFQTLFEYEGVVDPEELQALMAGMHRTIAAGEKNIARVQRAMDASKAAAEGFAATQTAVDGVYGTMNSNVAGMKEYIVGPGHFTRQLLDEAVIDDFYARDLRPVVAELRQFLAQTVGEDVLDMLVGAAGDLYNTGKAGEAIKKADLLRFHASRDKVPAHIKQVQGMMQNVRQEIGEADEVPQRNADSLRSSISTAYMVSCLPWIGIFAAAGVPGKIKKFEPAFGSSVPVYRELGEALLKKNSVMMKVALVLAVLLGLGGIGLFFALGLTPKPEINAGVPGAAFLMYATSAALFASAGKRLASALGNAPPVEQGEDQPAQQMARSATASDE